MGVEFLGLAYFLRWMDSVCKDFLVVSYVGTLIRTIVNQRFSIYIKIDTVQNGRCTAVQPFVRRKNSYLCESKFVCEETQTLLKR